MAINKNHEFEELNGVKCGIVEKNVKPERVGFLKSLLEFNGYTVIAIPSPPPKVTTAPATKEGEDISSSSSAAKATEDKAETFTVGVTDNTFNTTNAIFGRMLKTPDGHIVTLAYWNQEETVSHDEVPYYESK